MGRRCRKAGKKTGNFLRSHDLFGHKVDLNFNNRGSVHKTVVGGTVSLLLVKMLMGVYIFLLMRKLVTFGDDKIGKEVTLIPKEGSGV